MFSGIKRLIGAATVKEENGVITVEGVPADDIANDIQRIWATSRINNNMFIKFGKNSFSFYSFFAIEVRYVLVAIIQNPGRWTKVRAISHLVELLDTHTWIESLMHEHPPTLDYEQTKRLNVKLMPSQDEYFHVFSKVRPRFGLKGYMLASPPGTGKTIASSAVALGAKKDCIIVVAPKNAVYEVWTKTFEKFFRVVPKYWTTLMKGLPDDSHEFLVFHYESLGMALDYVERHKGRSYAIILDECHNMNSHESLRTIQFVKLCQMSNSDCITWMSGTPIKAIGSESIPFLKSIDPLFNDATAQAMMKIFGKSATRANDILANRIGLTTFKVEKAAVVELTVNNIEHKFTFHGADRFTLDNIKAEIQAFVVERTEYYKKHFKEFESLYETCIKIFEGTLSGNQMADFNKYRDYIKTIRKGFDPVLHKEAARFCNVYEKKTIVPILPDKLKKPFLDARSVVKYVELKIRGEALGRILGRRRIDCFAAMVEHCGIEEYVDRSEKKTVIFTSYIDVVENLKQYFIDRGYKPLVVYGETVKDLPAIVKRFEEDIDANPLIATYDSLSTAVPLVMANTCILFNQPFREYIVNQATSRVARKGQDCVVHIVNVLLETGGKPNISTRSLDLVEWSRQQVDVIMGNTSAIDDVALESFGIDPEGEDPAEIADTISNAPPSAIW